MAELNSVILQYMHGTYFRTMIHRGHVSYLTFHEKKYTSNINIFNLFQNYCKDYKTLCMLLHLTTACLLDLRSAVEHFWSCNTQYKNVGGHTELPQTIAC